ncbi:MAG: thiamine pyrophosphate-binding protein [Lachnospiraceae bacterium]|nr:thiamine pyrophosphate-binding protein [Lachnospiraceae bacterium]
MSGADAIVKCLLKEGVDTIFGYSGVAIDPFWNSVGKTKIRQILVRTEQNAGHAASGYARASRKVGVCAVTSGPGATNLLTGIATAFADSIPLVCITGQVESDCLGQDVFQEADIVGAAESFVKYSYLVKNARDIPRVVKEAFYIASTGRRGPVLIDLPYDIQNSKMPDFDYSDEIPKMRTYKPTVKGNLVQIKKVAEELNKAKRPLICCGGGIHLSGAREILREFVDRNSIPVVSTMMGLGVLPSSHPLYFGMVGNNGFRTANFAMRESDLLIMVGARVADRAVSSPDLVLEGKVLVHMDVDPAEIGKNVGPTIPLVGDAKTIFEDFLDLKLSCRTEGWISRLTEQKAANVKAYKTSDEYVNQALFVKKLSESMEEDAIYVADVGQNQLFSCRNVVIKAGRFFTSGGMGTMGYSIPAAIGARAADEALKERRAREEPEEMTEKAVIEQNEVKPGDKMRQIVAVCGDGAFQMSMCELAVVSQYKLPIKIAVMKNHFLGLVREHQHFAYHDQYNMVDLGDFPDLKLIAKAYGIDYVRLSKDSEMEERIGDFLADERPMLMEVNVDPMDLTTL